MMMLKWSLVIEADSRAAKATLMILLNSLKPNPLLRIEDLQYNEPHLLPQVVFHCDDPRDYSVLLNLVTQLGQATIR